MGDWFEEMSRRTPVVAVTDDIPRGALLGSSDYDDAPDPHVWFDVALWTSTVGVIERALIQRDPDGVAEYRGRARSYSARLRALDREVRRRLAAIPRRQRVLVTSHDAFAYLGRRYGLDVQAIQGISTVAEATTNDIERVADAVAERGVPAVFVESSVSPQTMRAVQEASARKGHRVEIGPELFADSAGGEGTPEARYIDMVRANATRIAQGLGR